MTRDWYKLFDIVEFGTGMHIRENNSCINTALHADASHQCTEPLKRNDPLRRYSPRGSLNGYYREMRISIVGGCRQFTATQ
jgi:hypothetical protein